MTEQEVIDQLAAELREAALAPPPYGFPIRVRLRPREALIVARALARSAQTLKQAAPIGVGSN